MRVPSSLRPSRTSLRTSFRPPLRVPSLAASLLAPLVALACAACAASSSAPATPAAALVVPSGGPSTYVFRAGTVDARTEGGTRQAFAVPAASGGPVAAGVDPYGGWAAVAYDSALYAVQLAESRILPIEGVRWTSPPVAIGVRGALAATVEDRTIGLYRVADGVREWKADGDRLLSEAQLEELRFALPLARDRILLVGTRSMGMFSQPATVVLEVDLSAGTPSVPRQQSIPALHRVGSCASDGRHLYLAGEHEVEQHGVGVGRQALVQSLLVVRVDPDGLRQRELVREEMPGRTVVVRQVAVGYGLVAVVLDDRELLVYQDAGAAATRALLRQRFAEPVSVACVDATHVAVASATEARILAIAGVVQRSASVSTTSPPSPAPTTTSTHPSASGTAHSR